MPQRGNIMGEFERISGKYKSYPITVENKRQI
jgi:hypothetical protein